jgi:hypothetical protein
LKLSIVDADVGAAAKKAVDLGANLRIEVMG